jgi:hypothetical protein
VVYHGESGWSAARRLGELIRSPEGLAEYQVEFVFRLLDLSQLSDSEITGNLVLQSTLRLLKYSRGQQLGSLAKEATMSSIQDVSQLQLEAYRRMTGEERLRIGLGLYEASLGIAREGIRSRFPEADDAEVEEKLRSRIRAGYEIEFASKRVS